MATITLGRCPLARFPDKDNRVQWRGLTWRGIPAIWRWSYARAVRRGAKPLTGDVGGCGCLDYWKTKWEWLVYALI